MISGLFSTKVKFGIYRKSIGAKDSRNKLGNLNVDWQVGILVNITASQLLSGITWENVLILERHAE